MPEPPQTGDAVLELVRRSELADDDVLSAFLRDSGPLPPAASDTATRLVQAGILTPFQARAILLGKYRGFRLGPYRILDQIGVGGMGQVFLAEHSRMRRRVALKVLPAKLAADKVGVERFYREARAVAALDHPNIVRAYDIASDKGTHFLVLEYVDGRSLADLLAAGPVSVGEACGYAVQAAAGLQHAHEKGLAHRDVKPGNLLVGRDGVLKILDMGLARFFTDESDKLTQNLGSGAVMGTADYVAPEQLLDCSHADHRADLYSLGATLYHLVTGRPPFDGSTTAKLIAHQLKAVPPAHALRPDVPEELSGVIDRMMAKDPRDRYPSAAEAVAALLPFVGTDGGPASGRLPPIAAAAAAESTANLRRPTLPPADEAGTAPGPDRKKWLALAGLAAVVLLGGGLIAAVSRLTRDPRPEAANDPTPPPDPAGPKPPAPPKPPERPALTPAYRLALDKANVEAAVFTPGDRLLVTAGVDKAVRVWDGATGKPVRRMDGHAGNVRAVSLFPDGRRLLSASHDKTVKLWDLQTGECVRTYEGHAGKVVGVAALPDGRRFLSSDDEGAIWQWDAGTGEVLRRYDPSPLPVYALAVGRDGRRAVAGTWDAKRNAAKPDELGALTQVTVWTFDVETGKKLKETTTDTSVSHVRLSPDGTEAVVGMAAGVGLWNLDTGRFRPFTGVSKRTTCAAFTRDGRHVVSTGYDNAVTLWDAATGKVVAADPGLPGQGFNVAPAHDGRRVAAVGANGGAGVWTLPAVAVAAPPRADLPRPAATLTAPTGTPGDVVFSADGARVAGALDPSRHVLVWDAATGAEAGRLALPEAVAGHRRLAALADGRVASCGPTDPAVRVWDLAAGQLVRELTAGKVAGFFAVAALPDGRVLAAGADRAVHLWHPDRPDAPTRFAVGADVRGLAVTPDGRRFVVGTGTNAKADKSDKTVRLWDLGTGAEVRKRTVPATPWRVAVSPDGAWAAYGAGAAGAEAWNLDTGEARPFDAGKVAVDGVAFTRGGRYLLGGGADKGLYAWSVADRKLVGKVVEHTGAVRGLSLSPDGTRAVTSGADGTAVVWQLPDALAK
jgi:serine/threonine-protein kinase